MKHLIYFCLITILCTLHLSVLAKSEGSLSLEEFKYKRFNKTGFKTNYPNDGPFVVVSATNTTYDRVLDSHTDTQVIAATTASCSNRGKVQSLTVQAGNGPKEKVKGNSFRTDKWILKIPRKEFNTFNPIQQCNTSAKDIAAKRNIPLAEVVKNGFTVKLPRKIKIRAGLFCEGRGIQRGSSKGKNIDVDAYVVCKDNPLAGRAKKGKPKTKPAGKPEPGKATSAFKTAQVAMRNGMQTTQCPAKVELNAELNFNSPGQITAQWYASGGYKSPAQKISMNKAGKKRIKHTLLVDKPKASNTQLTSKPMDNIQSGWARLVVTHTVKQGIARTNKKWQSKKMNYKITCSQPKQMNLQLKKSG